MPIHYEIFLDTLMEKNNFKFNGEVIITTKVEEITNNIELYMGSDMKILSTELRLSGDLHNIVEITVEQNKEKELWTIKCKKLLEIGDIYTIKMQFESKLSNDNFGFYTISYKNSWNGQLTWIAATNFKPAFARRAFPCYDEPDMKATFQLTLKYPDNLFSTVTGSKITFVSCAGEKQMLTSFEKTPKISTYQLGFALTDLPKRDSNQTHGIKITSYYRRIADNLLQEAILYSTQMFDIAYARFNGDVTFPAGNGTEIMQFMIPNKYTEDTTHWNIIFYSEQDLYYHSRLHKLERFNDVLLLLARNMIYHWFSYATPQWWNDFWISEGISIYYSYKNTKDLFPKNKILEQYQFDVLHVSFRIDAVRNVMSLTNFLDESDDIFKAIEFYRQKSPCIIRMMKFALNDACFDQAIENILANKQHQNVDSKYFFEMFDLALIANGFSNLDAKNTFGQWFTQSGYPMVNITITKKEMHLSQRHFQSDGSFQIKIWNIPINYLIPNIKLDKTHPQKPRFWLNTFEMKFGITERGFNSAKDWLILNINQSFYYRVNYDEKNWNLIVAALNKKHTVFSLQTRAQLIDDAFSLAKAGYLKHSILEKLIDYMKNERQPHPLKVFRRAVMDFTKGSPNPLYRSEFNKLAKKIDRIQLNFPQNTVKNDQT